MNRANSNVVILVYRCNLHLLDTVVTINLLLSVSKNQKKLMNKNENIQIKYFFLIVVCRQNVTCLFGKMFVFVSRHSKNKTRNHKLDTTSKTNTDENIQSKVNIIQYLHQTELENPTTKIANITNCTYNQQTTHLEKNKNKGRKKKTQPKKSNLNLSNPI